MEIVLSQTDLTAGAEYNVRELHDGIQVRIKFPSNYGLSVVRHQYSYGGPEGLWEAAPICYVAGHFDHWEFIGRSKNIPGFENDDVKGWLTETQVDEIAQMVALL